jgi:hypothetical protein
MWNLLIPAVTSIIDKLIPDPAQATEAKLKALDMAQKGELAELDAAVKLAAGQLEVNKAEASSGDAFTSRWRPVIGYVIGAALAFHYILNPLILWIAAFAGAEIKVPSITLDDHLWELVMGMLGLAGWRTLDKIKGVSK